MMLLALVSHLGFGAWFAWTFQQARSLYQDRYPWPLVLLLLGQGFLVMPIDTLLLRFYADWWTGYWLDPDIHPSFTDAIGWLSLVQWLLGALLAYTGFVGFGWSKRHRYLWLRRATLAVPLLLLLLCLTVLGPKIIWVGTFEQYQQQQSQWLLQTLPGWLWLSSYGARLLYLRWCYGYFGSNRPSWW